MFRNYCDLEYITTVDLKIQIPVLGTVQYYAIRNDTRLPSDTISSFLNVIPLLGKDLPRPPHNSFRSTNRLVLIIVHQIIASSHFRISTSTTTVGTHPQSDSPGLDWVVDQATRPDQTRRSTDLAQRQ